MQNGDLVTHKLTGKQMVVILYPVMLSNFPLPMYRCRYELPTGTFAVDHFTREELIAYEETVQEGVTGIAKETKEVRAPRRREL